MDLAQFATTAGALPLIVGIVEVMKRSLGWDDAATSRFAPLVSLIVGVIIVTSATIIVGPRGLPITTQELVATGILTGVLAGLGAVGLYDVVGGNVIERIAGDSTDTAGPQ